MLRATAFFDGQNLFHTAKEAFGYPFPNYDPLELAKSICVTQGWELTETRFYTGIPDSQADPKWHRFWSAKLAVMGTRGITCYSRHLRYQNVLSRDASGQTIASLVGREKGIDVRIALDIVRLAIEGAYDVGLIFSQDQDLSEAVDDVVAVARRGKKFIKMACAFPNSPTLRNRRGINGTDWIKTDRATYDACIDPIDYRKDP